MLPQGEIARFARHLNALSISAAEFGAAARDYPIVFASLDKGSSFAPVVVLGLEREANLFVDAAGGWDGGAYLPAFVRRYPFCIAKLYVDGEARSERVVCVVKACIDEGGTALFDAQGGPTPRWQATERLLAEYEADLDRTAQMCAALARLQLLEPFTLQAAEVKLGGMYRVSEPKLRALEAASHKLLVGKGWMGLVYAHVHSLQNFSRLEERRRRGSRG